jgi:signal transduction histidine kinase
MWLIIALVFAFSVVAAVLVGGIARETVFEQHVRRLQLETDQLSSQLGLALEARLGAIRALTARLDVAQTDTNAGDSGNLFRTLTATYPEFDWLAASDSRGVIVASNGALRQGTDVHTAPWFAAATERPWLGVIEEAAQGASAATEARTNPATPTALGTPTPPTTHNAPTTVSTSLGDFALPVRDANRRSLGVIVVRASWRRAARHFERLTDDRDPDAVTEVVVLDRDGRVLVGPAPLRGRVWTGVPIGGGAPGPPPAPTPASPLVPEFERLPDGRQLLVSRVPLGGGDEVASLGWQVQLGEPNAHVYQRADAVAVRILWISLALGAITALLGIRGARRLTRRLQRLTQSVTRIGMDDTLQLDVPTGVDEVARLGAAFAHLLGALQEERRELERRVAERTREVERLAEESRYAAIVRERLQIARDLHDTLAHSMMAMLSEIRLLRRLESRDPGALAAELQRAEEVAHAGLGEARKAITQMRSNTVREMGLGPALASAFNHFIDRTGLTGEFSADPEAARFGDERGEVFLRIAQEVFRNVERHAKAARVTVRLNLLTGARLVLDIVDDGVGFDVESIAPGHFGLLGLREQADLIGAKVQIDSRIGRGTSVVLAVDLAPVAFGLGP